MKNDPFLTLKFMLMKKKITLPHAKQFIGYLHQSVFAISITLLLSAFSFFFMADGILKGKVIDKDTKEPIAFANVLLELNDTLVGGATTDFNGNYVIESIEPGIYDVKATYVGYKPVKTQGIVINADQVRFFDIEIEPTAVELSGVEIVEYVVPLIDKDETRSGGMVTSKEIAKMPGRDASSTVSCIGGVYSADGERGSVRGSRSKKTTKHVDGMKVPGSAALPKSSVEKEPSELVESPPEIIEPESKVKACLLTAGEIHDFSKWELWKDISGNELKNYQKLWKIKPENRYCVQVMNKESFPVVGCQVKLVNENDKVIWASETDNTGKAEVWLDLFETESQKGEKYRIEVVYKNLSKRIKKPKVFHKGINSVILDTGCDVPETVDILFAVDATGSMGDEINYLKAELKNIIEKFSTRHPDLKLRMGSLFYRDIGDVYVTRNSDFSSDIQQTIDFIDSQYAGGGGDTPEAVDEALNVAVNELSWSTNARAKLLFLILDAPPHNKSDNIKKLQQAIEKASATGIQIIPIAASGINKSGEYLLRSIALATNGTYVFLTDDSGIGGRHIKPSTDKYTVELLNELLLRLFYQFTETPKCTEPELLTLNESNISDQNQIDGEEKQNTDLSSDEDIKDDKTEIKEHKMKFYPNPTSGKLTINSKGKIDEAYLTDISGKILERYDFKEKRELVLYLDRFPSGIYFIKYQHKNKWHTGKVILTR